MYIVEKDGYIYLEVVLPLDKIYGRVVWENEPLDSVIVSIGNLKDTTDQLDYYEIYIPETLQKKEQEVNFDKPGFISQKQTAFPQTQKALEIVMEKKK